MIPLGDTMSRIVLGSVSISLGFAGTDFERRAAVERRKKGEWGAGGG
jgi:hypothetical protein